MRNEKRFRLDVDRKKLDDLPQTVRDKLSAVVVDTAINIQRGTQANIRKHDLIDTGAMINSVAVNPLDDTGMMFEIIIGVDYGIYHELGTIHLSARHMMGEAVEEVTDQFFEAIKQVLNE